MFSHIGGHMLSTIFVCFNMISVTVFKFDTFLVNYITLLFCQNKIFHCLLVGGHSNLSYGYKKNVSLLLGVEGLGIPLYFKVTSNTCHHPGGGRPDGG